jgi:DNA-binding winged helix-turn-helix (wHTH) protein/TolB-like protein/Tfp pilus assembly protein PilF
VRFSAQTNVLRFDVFEVDLDSAQLRDDGNAVPLQDKPLQLLILLLQKAGQTVTREEIRRELWGPDTFVEFDDSLNHAVRKLREALRDSAESPRYIKTLPRRGYQFIFPLQAESPSRRNAGAMQAVGKQPLIGAGANPAPGSGSRRRLLMALGLTALLLLPWRSGTDSGPVRSLLVLPLRSLDGGSSDGFLGEGISEQVTARLTPVAGLRLIASAAAHRVGDSGMSPQEAGQRLHVDAVLAGSVRRVDRKVRVNAQLIRTGDNQILWAEGGLEVEGRDLLETEKMLAASIATRLRGPLARPQRVAISHSPTSRAEAYELFVRGKLAQRSPAADRQQVAEKLFQQAIQLDPAFAEAYAWLALAQYGRFEHGDAGDESRVTGLRNARRALEIDPGVTAARRALINIFHSTGQAEEGLKEASILRHSGAADSDSLAAMATAYLRAGMPDRAVPLYQQALNLDSEDTVIRRDLAFSAYFAGQHELGLRVMEGHPLQSGLIKMSNAHALGRRRLARSVALETIQGPTTPPGIVALCGLMLQELGEGELARRIWRKRALELEGTLGGIRNERNRIGLGRIYAGLGDKIRALEQLRLALQTNPGDPWSLFYASAIYAEVGDERGSLASLREAVDRGFLAIHYLDHHFEHWPNGLHRFRSQPEFREVRERLASKVAWLRARY